MMMKLRMLLDLWEFQKRREVWKNSWIGVVWESIKFWNIWSKIVTVFLLYSIVFSN